MSDTPTPLAETFRRLIRSTGPISLAHFMAESNARYYASRDPLGADVPAFRNDGTDADFGNRAGDHHDGIEWFGLDASGKPSDSFNSRGLLAMNHEATTDEKLASFFIHANGGTATVSNLRFDLANQTVVADLTGMKSAVGTRPSVNYSLPGTTFWTFANVATETESINSTTFASTVTISGLSLTGVGYDFLVDALGLRQVGRSALSGVGQQGSIQTRLVFSAAVPEPSTYALLGVGLVGICVGLRRRAAAN